MDLLYQKLKLRKESLDSQITYLWVTVSGQQDPIAINLFKTLRLALCHDKYLQAVENLLNWFPDDVYQNRGQRDGGATGTRQDGGRKNS